MIKNKKHSSGKKRERQTRYLSQAIQLEEAVNPHIIRATMTMVSLAILVFLGWAGLTNINEVARTPGEVVPQGYQQTVQHLEGGIVKEINVKEGGVVEEGDVLLTLDDSSLKKDMERATLKDLDLAMQAERLRAFVQNREPDFTKFDRASTATLTDQRSFFDGMKDSRTKEEAIVLGQIAERKQSIHALRMQLNTARSDMSIAQNMYDKRAQLNSRGYASDMQLLQDQRQLNAASGEIRRLQNQILVSEKEIGEYQSRLTSLSAQHQDEAYERLAQVESDKAQNSEIIEKLQERMSRLALRAPTRGLVKGLTVNTIGAVIQPGQTVMEIIPLDKNLEVAVKISPQDIGHLKIGQDVQVKFSTYDFSRYGSIKGKLEQVSATTFSGDNGNRYYQGRVLLSQNYVGESKGNIIMPGMTVMADVITGEKTILQYLLKPIHLSLRTAFTER